MKAATQFDWRRHWKKKVEPFLQHELVQRSLDLGMLFYDSAWKRGDAPCHYGRLEGRRVVPGKLSSYRPWGRCHYIAYFSMSIGAMNYPDLDWRLLIGDLHTVPVGFDAKRQPMLVMDILLFDRMTATESIDLTQKKAICEINQEGSEQFNILTGLFIENMLPAIRAVANGGAQSQRVFPGSVCQQFDGADDGACHRRLRVDGRPGELCSATRQPIGSSSKRQATHSANRSRSASTASGPQQVHRTRREDWIPSSRQQEEARHRRESQNDGE